VQGEDYEPQQIADYGLQAQPALVERMRPQPTLTLLGSVSALLAVVTALAALVTFPDFTGEATGSGWALGATIAAVVLLAIGAFQHVAWRRAMAEWTGARHYALGTLTRVSWLLHLLSYIAVLFALWACTAGSIRAGTTSNAAALLALSLLFMVVSQVLAGVQYLRIDGPSGTIPGHLRRLGDEIRRRR
jgi:hypothetical protein